MRKGTGGTHAKLEILLEENAFGSVRFVEVVADAPVAALVPALVAELNLPRTDLFGKELVYTLRDASAGYVIPDHTTLKASGIRPGTRMALDSYAPDDIKQTPAPVVANSALYSAAPGDIRQAPAPVAANSVLHSAITLSNEADWQAAGWQGVQAPAAVPPVKKGRSRSRRAFLVLSGAVLGLGGVGVGYAAYQSYMGHSLVNVFRSTVSGTLVTNTQPQKSATTQPKATTPALPTTAKATLTFTQHRQTVRAVSWSPDGTLLASGADDEHVFIWGVDGAVKHNLQMIAAARAVAWSPDSKRLATGASTQIAFYNAQTGTRLAKSTHTHTQAITSLSWAAKQPMQIVSGSLDKRAIVWDTVHYKAVTIYTKHDVAVLGVSWAADSQTIASSSQGGFVRVWEAANGQDLHDHFEDAALPMEAVAFAPTGMQLAVGGDDGLVRLWNGLTCVNTANAQCTDVPQRLRASQKALHTLAWSPDGRFLAVGADDGKISVWMPAQNQKLLFTLQQNAAVQSITWSPDSKQMAAASGTTVTIWTLM